MSNKICDVTDEEAKQMFFDEIVYEATKDMSEEEVNDFFTMIYQREYEEYLKTQARRKQMTNEEKVLDAGYTDEDEIILFKNPSFEGALVGVSEDKRAIYDFDKMIESLMRDEDMDEEQAMEWISYNTIRSLPYMTEKAPIIMYLLEEK